MVPFEKLTEQARQTLARSQELLVRLGHNALDTEHLLLVLLGQRDGPVPMALKQLDTSPAAVLEALQQELARRPSAGQGGSLYITTRANGVVDRAMADAERRGDSFVGTEHLLLAAIAAPSDPASRLFAAHGLDRAALERAFESGRAGRKVDD